MDDEWADRPGEDFVKGVSTKDLQQRHLWSRRGTFTDFGEAKMIAKSSERASYVAMAPLGGYSIFKMNEPP
jgi:hypothetical protein